ncbi:MAG: TIGR04222 domain-containing membrane protein [Planctomycetota bacterium]
MSDSPPSNPESKPPELEAGLEAFARRVEAFEIDPGDKALSFTARLARENDWTLELAARVIREYKRFCILAMRAGHPVTPSEFVDQAWHLHLTYTRSYWDRFCKETLGAPLHHDPTSGGSREGEKFRDWYAATLDRYQEVFGQEPPEDVWPSPEDRFRHAGQWRWINVGHHWVVSKKSAALATVSVVVVLILFAIPGCRVALDSALANRIPTTPFAFGLFPFNLGGTAFLVFYALLCFLTLSVVLTLRRNAAEQRDGSQTPPLPDSLTADELAVLAGGGSRLAHVGLTRLYTAGCIEPQSRWLSKKLVPKRLPSDASTLDRDIYTLIETGKSPSEVMAAVKPHFERIDLALQAKGLRRAAGWISSFAGWLTALVILIAVARLIQGVLKGEEIDFLVAMMVGMLVLCALLNYRTPGPTAAGKKLLENLKKDATSRREKDSKEASSLNSHDTLASDVALLGAVAIADDVALEPIASMFPHVGQSSAASSSGCGSGCSGCGGGGCGGGGCGGCGG